MTKIADLRGKSHDELKELVVSLKKEQFNLRFQGASGEAPKPSRFREIRRDIARAKTLLNTPAGTAPVAKKAKAPKAAKAEKVEKKTEEKAVKAKKTTKKKAGE